MSEPKPHERVNDILLGPLERPALQWLAEHMPARVTPDVLTGIGIVGSLITFIGYWASSSAAVFLWLASLGLVVNWFGDSLDGTLARYRNIERPKFGFFIDHTMDSVSETLIVFGLGLSPYVSFEVAAVALIGYLLMSVLVYVRTYVTGEFRISYGRLGPTEVRVIIILFNAVLFFVGQRMVSLWFGEVSIYDFAIGGLGVALIILFLVSTTLEARQLAKVGE
ncbi:MAG: CDP-alcohol phosphatidyltransferase family protein [Acidimicrobiia bacterium]|nr:CDP-alcohol phosphatidyltransferase family protein [Acidimicrobiia bacterium]MDH3396374.1 CDP-alcohol phosphatidyltransferase family protein [Acidimicrobiia bacterium]MDH5614997.1 CDP-alcohol phosphatidyltransferase family protein [Acidimicrobiia bacterium]